MSTKIAKYEILEKLGEGGFGVVFKARDPFIKRLVAIKTCSLETEELRKRFFREAQIAGRFDHPNVTLVHDFGVDGEMAYLVQEYLDGEDLIESIHRRDALSLDRKIEILEQIAAGLAYAHSEGVIHRDIKPANVRILESGQAKILDFGIAKLVSSKTVLTQEGVAVGTLGYLSPEQLNDQQLDRRTDIFSFGVVAYELLTYRSPFGGRDISTLIRQIFHEHPTAVTELVPECPAALGALVERCLAKDREERYASCDEVLEELAEIRASLPPETAAIATRPTEALPARPTEASFEDVGDDDDTGPVSRPVETRQSPPGVERRETLPAIDSSLEEGEAEARSAARPPSAAPLATTPIDGQPAGGAETRPARERRPKIDRKTALLVGGVALVLVVVVIGIWMLDGRDELPEMPPEEVAEISTQAIETPMAGRGPTGRLLVVASPWGRLESLTGPDGERIELPSERFTPFLLELPPGAYRAELSHPDVATAATCTAELEVGARSECRVELVPVDTTEYFRQTGWWR